MENGVAAFRFVSMFITPTLVRLARDADPASTYLHANGAALHFKSASFDLVVAYNSLMDVDDMPGVVPEIGRVLSPEGCLGVCITHPLMDAGRFTARETEAPFVIEGSYFGRRPYEVTYERAGLRVSFKSWCYPLAAYTQALETAGLVVEALREPEPAAHVPARLDRYRRIPNFLMVRARKAAR